MAPINNWVHLKASRKIAKVIVEDVDLEAISLGYYTSLGVLAEVNAAMLGIARETSRVCYKARNYS